MNIAPTEQQLRSARRSIVRSSMAWLPFFTLFSAGAVFFLIRALTDDAGAWVGFAILGLIALLILPLLVAALQDLRAAPIETEGLLGRKWSKADFFVFRSHYFLIGKRVFRVNKAVWVTIPEPPGRIHLLHYPHTNTLIDWKSVPDPSTDPHGAPAAAARAWRPLPDPPASAAPPPARPIAPAGEPLSVGERLRPAAGPAPRFDPPGRIEPPRFDQAPSPSSPGRPDGATESAGDNAPSTPNDPR